MGKGTVNHRPPALIIAVCFTFYNRPAATTLFRIRLVILNLIHCVTSSFRGLLPRRIVVGQWASGPVYTLLPVLRLQAEDQQVPKLVVTWANGKCRASVPSGLWLCY